jgi:hypothetical protein
MIPSPRVTNLGINNIPDAITSQEKHTSRRNLLFIQLRRHAELRDPTLPDRITELLLINVTLLLGGHFLDLHKS